MPSRRSFLSTAISTAGAGMAVWPLIPYCALQAAEADTATFVVDAEAQPAGSPRRVQFQGVPIFVVKRTPEMLEAMQRPDFVAGLPDPYSQKRQQPPYAQNWHRSIDPTVAVLVGICTACACVPVFQADATIVGVPGGYICPCCATHYDQPEGRMPGSRASTFRYHLIGKSMPRA
jgi:ubiquinol-cytochrome c reductase iron-sulfur subunit